MSPGGLHHRRYRCRTMSGLDVSQKTTAICVVDEQGRRLWRGACVTDPGAISARVSRHAGVVDVKVGVETGPMTPWLVPGPRRAGLVVGCFGPRAREGPAPDRA